MHMAAGNATQHSFRKALGALKDSTMVGMAKVNSEYKELDVAILKATNHVEVLPKEKHVRTIFHAVSCHRPRADVGYCIVTLSRRLTKTHTWAVALKTLIVIHRALREVDDTFREELVNYSAHRGYLLNLSHFKDDSSPIAWDYSTWLRCYSLYLEEYLECYRIMKYDFQTERKRTKELDTPTLIEKLPALQQLLFRLLACQPVGAAKYNFLIQHALSIIAAESVNLYVAIADGMLNLVDKFFEMQRNDAVKALDIYRRAGDQAVKLSVFFEVCRSLDFGRGQKYVKIERPPESFILAMEEYVKDAPNTLMLQWRPDDDDTTTPKVIAAPGSNLDTDHEQVTEVPRNEESSTETTAPPLIPDLLSFDEPSQESAVLEDNNALALVISTPEDLRDSLTGSHQSSEPASWELALVEASCSNQAPSNDNKLVHGGVLDRSMLDTLYDVALARVNLNETYNAEVSSNPFEVADNSQNAFYTSQNFGTTSDAQMAAMPYQHDYDGFMQQQFANMSQKQESFVNPQQEEVLNLHQQTSGMPQAEETQITATPQQLEGPTLVRDTNPFGNPFVEHEFTDYPSQNQSHVAQNQNSESSLI